MCELRGALDSDRSVYVNALALIHKPSYSNGPHSESVMLWAESPVSALANSHFFAILLVT